MDGVNFDDFYDFLPEGFDLPTIDTDYYYYDMDWSYGGYSGGYGGYTGGWGGYSYGGYGSYYGGYYGYGDYSWYYGDYYGYYGYYGYGGYGGYGYYGGWDYYGYYGDYGYGYGDYYGDSTSAQGEDLFVMIMNGADDIIYKFDELNDIVTSGMFSMMGKSDQKQLLQELTNVLYMVPVELLSERQRDKLIEKLQSGDESQMVEAWEQIHEGAMEALEEAQNMVELIPDLDDLGALVVELAGDNIREAMEE